MSFFVNFIGSLKNLNSYETNTKQSKNATIVTYSGSISASFVDKFGFNIKATNGTYFDNRSLVDEQKNVKYNYKFNDTSKSNVGRNYFIKFWINYISRSLENNHQLNYLNFNFSLDWKI